jgi:membrane-bound lytic murein transglycosylase D
LGIGIMTGKLKTLIIALGIIIVNQGLTFAQDQKADSTEVFMDDEDSIELTFDSNLDSLLNLYYVNQALDGDTALMSFDEDTLVPDFPDSVYIDRLSKIPSVVDLSYNRIVRNYIEMYTKKRRNTVEVMLGLSEYYFPIFDNIFDYYDVPNELKYMSIIESALNPRAYSRARAVGLWQFMYGTGKLYGLNINSLVDERRDPIKSTHAAAKFVKDLYSIYHDWTLVIAAYNCGPGNVNKAIRRAGGKTNYWDIYYYLPRETRGHVPAFIAAVYVMNYYKEHNLKPKSIDLPLANDTIMITKPLNLAQVSSVLGIPIKLLEDMNPQYRRDIIPAYGNKSYSLRIPMVYTSAFIDMEDSIYSYKDSVYFNPDKMITNPTAINTKYYYEPPSDKYDKLHYTVKSGDNLGFIAMWYHVRLSDLRYWNNIRRNMIRSGQRLSIYVPKSKYEKYKKINTMSFAQKQATIGKTVSPNNNQTVNFDIADLDGDFEYYTVKSGDTLWDIAKKFPGVTDTDIMRLNSLDNASKIKPGQKLKIKPKS